LRLAGGGGDCHCGQEEQSRSESWDAHWFSLVDRELHGGGLDVLPAVGGDGNRVGVGRRRVEGEATAAAAEGECPKGGKEESSQG